MHKSFRSDLKNLLKIIKVSVADLLLAPRWQSVCNVNYDRLVKGLLFIIGKNKNKMCG